MRTTTAASVLPTLKPRRILAPAFALTAITCMTAYITPAVAISTAAARQKRLVTTPGPRALLQRILKAHENLGPSYIESVTRSERAPGHDRVITRDWMRRNDSRHYVLSWEARPGLPIIYVNDPQVVTYRPSMKTYTRERLGSDNDNLLFGLLYYIEQAFPDPDAHSWFARTKVLPVTYQGIPCYKVLWDPKSPTSKTAPPPPKHSGPGLGPPTAGAYVAPFRVLIVGRKDGLVRKIIQDSGTGETLTQIFSYQFRSRPYPLSTFNFRPPRGAKEEVHRMAE